MIRIVLSGAPKSGKSALANAIVENEFADGPLSVIDNYTEEITDRGTAIGMFGDYFINQWVYFERYRMIRQHTNQLQSYICCGSEVDSYAYAAMEVDLYKKDIFAGDDGPSLRAAIGAGIMGTFFVDKFYYDLGYIVPFRETGDPDDDFYTKVNDTIMELNLMANLGLPILNGSFDENVTRITDDINGFHSAAHRRTI